MNDDRFDLASAYLDGAVTPAERALAEADPEVMELVEQLRALSSSVRDVEPPSDDSRELVIAAALDAAFPTAATPPAQVVPFAPRSRLSRVLAYAAAVLAVGIVGSVAVTGLRGVGDDDAATSTDDVEMFAVDTADEPDDLDAVPEAFPPAEAGDADDADAPAADDAMSTMEAPATESGDPSDTDSSGADVIQLDRFTEAEIAELVGSLLDHDGSEERAADGFDVCPDVLDEVAADPALVTVYDDRPVVVGIAGELVRVVDPVGCDVLVEVEREHAGG